MNMLDRYIIVKAMQHVTASPEKSFSVRGMAKEAGISAGASKQAFDFMKKQGIVSLKKIGKTYQYRADISSALCRQWKKLFNLSELEEAGLLENVLAKLPNVQSVLLYGSMAKGTNDKKSDFDLLVVTQKPCNAGKVSTGKSRRETNLSVFSFKEWKKKTKENKVFYENVIYDSIVLFGERPVVT